MTKELEVIIDGQLVKVPTEDAEVRRNILLSLLKRFQREIIVKYDGRVICTSTVD